MKVIKQLLVLTTNRPGILANVCGTLADEKINIGGISVVDHVDHALIRMIVSDTTRALHLLGESGLPVMEDEVISLALSGGPGALETVAESISQAGVNIHYAYASEPPDGGPSTLIIKTSDDKKAIQSLKKIKNVS